MFIFSIFEKYRLILFYKYYSIVNYFNKLTEPNIMNLRYFIKNKNQLYCSITGIAKYKQLFVNVHINIEKKNFDISKQAAKKNYSNHFKLNSFLSDYRTKIENWYLEFISNYSKFEYDFFVSEIKRFLNNADDKNFFQYFEEYINYKENLVNKSTLKNYNTLKNLLIEFQEHINYKLSFDSINFAFFNKFQEFCINKQFSNNYIKKQISTLIAFLNYCKEMNYTKNENYLKFAGKIKLEKPTTHTINYDEFEIIKHSSTSNKTLQKVKDLFLFLCYSGFRINEVRMINKEMIEVIPNTDFFQIKLIQKKTGNVLEQAILHKKAMDILQKNDYFENLMTDQRLNIYLKELAKTLNLNRSVIIMKKSGGETLTSIKKVSETIATHWGRRFFVTYLKTENANNSIISQNTGHSNDSMINLYDKRTQIEKDVHYLQGLELFNN